MWKKISSLFSKKTKLERLQKEQASLLKKAYLTSTNNRKISDNYVKKANLLAEEIDIIIHNNNNQ
tara:strand:- start:780 stop:974 length:195 start_codon:yes stop_codon:yes gene_type:complete